MIYVVGSMEKLESDSSRPRNYFVFHTAFLEETHAVSFCDKQRNDDFDWVVLKGEVGAEWICWDEVHRTRRIG